MIALVRGKLHSIGSEYVVVETGGIGFLVYVPRSMLHELGDVGSEVELLTLLIVREDALTLYGFRTADQRRMFETLLSVTGVGARMALNLLSSATPDELRLAVAQKDTARLSRVPGVGKKTAERLVLELKSKLDLKGLPTATTDAPPAVVSLNSELAELLTQLGYSAAEAQEAIAKLPADAPPDLEERLRLALRHFS